MVLPGLGPPDPELDCQSSSASAPNSGPNPGPVWEGSGLDQSSEPNRGNTSRKQLSGLLLFIAQYKLLQDEMITEP